MAKTTKHGESQKGKVTIFDVAKQAGVSIKTVSRVVNNEPNVRQQTKQKVLDAVGRLRYRPNTAARALSGRKSWVLGLVYENPHEFSYMKDVLNGALSACEAGEYSLLLRPLTLPSPDVAERIERFIIQARGGGNHPATTLGRLSRPPAAAAQDGGSLRHHNAQDADTRTGEHSVRGPGG